MNETYLAHHGVKGQKWGVRRYEDLNGNLTEAGKKRYSGKHGLGKYLYDNNVRAQDRVHRSMGSALGGVAAYTLGSGIARGSTVQYPMNGKVHTTTTGLGPIASVAVGVIAATGAIAAGQAVCRQIQYRSLESVNSRDSTNRDRREAIEYLRSQGIKL